MSDLPDLNACDREPIHIPGSIQPHGVLIVADAATRTILQISENAADVLGVDLDAVLDAPLHEVIGLPDDLFIDDERPAHSSWVPVVFPHDVDKSGWYATVHAYDTRWMIEIEPREDYFDDDPLRVAYDLTHKLEIDGNVQRAATRVARTIRGLLGYDRVMVYRFDHDWHGEVVAESRKDELEPYLGLHYPATDIPVQARALYLRNRVRQISDCKYIPSRILPPYDPQTSEATDLSDVSLRSVSPVHLEYLGNMGVTATLVASIIANGRLWGLIACHHYSPFFCDHRMRQVADSVARAFATRVAAIEEMDKIEVESTLLTVREKLITAFNESDRIDPELLATLAPELLEVVDADGVAIFAGNRVIRHGHLPDEAALLRIRDVVGTSDTPMMADSITGVLNTDEVGRHYPELAGPEFAGLAAGVIFMPLQADSHNAVVWTRAEQVRNVRWAGNPSLAKLEVIPGARLSPRQSFSSWQETVRGRSRPWSRQHLDSARGLRVLIEMMERKHYQQSFALMRASLSRLPDAIVITDASHADWRQCQIVFVNGAFVRATGHRVESLAGLHIGSILVGDDAMFARRAGTLDAAEAARIDVALRKADGGVLQGRLELEPVTDATGTITHWMSVHHRA
ncbi:PAS domain-containing sensor histidine kinase [Luteibacter sp. 22Crub2.1]|uniref:PAS domain-containing sensor histidine kinase n=1 Tax=Luteibacter sp. 22Crub2.1 TaxID=1283288 RepID=UPI0009C7E165|nr:PAS domain-containing sensor histidine kinase [Luteibacter sp. 22Crub2.1]SKB42490.1 PAS domain S-box-containing protein [Luteibacter sp. 22Crub2.1]